MHTVSVSYLWAKDHQIVRGNKEPFVVEKSFICLFTSVAHLDTKIYSCLNSNVIKVL